MNELKGRIFDVSDVRVEGAGHAAASERHWRLSNASGVHVYQADGGWRADLMFAGLPEGVPDVLGTPPMATRAKALEGIVATMSVCAQRDRLPRPEAVDGLLWFRFDEHMVPVDPGMLEHFVSRVPVVAFDADHIRKELDLLRADISGDAPVTAASWAAAEFQLRYDACRMCCAAMAFGIMELAFEPEPALALG